MKNPALERHHRSRVIQNRLRTIRDVFGAWGFGNAGVGTLSKDHFTNCSCMGCSSERVIRHRRRHLPRRRKLRTCHPNDWWEFEAVAEGW